MSETGSSMRKYMITFAVGAAGGGLLFAWATRAMPRMMSRMMQTMMTKMQREGCDPTEM